MMQEEIYIEHLNHKAEGIPWSISSIRHSRNLDTLLEYGSSALLHITVSQGTDPAAIQYICEYVFSQLGEDGELNFSITVISEPQDTVGIDILVTNTVTEKEASLWY